MKALTIHRPWSDAIVNGRKRIENRTWSPPHRIIGEMIAIHAGVKYDEEAAWLMVERGLYEPPGPDDCPTGIVGVARVVGAVSSGSDPWFSGPIGWVLEDVWALPPVQCRGSQGLWVVPGDVYEEMRKNWDKRTCGVCESPVQSENHVIESQCWHEDFGIFARMMENIQASFSMTKVQLRHLSGMLRLCTHQLSKDNRSIKIEAPNDEIARVLERKRINILLSLCMATEPNADNFDLFDVEISVRKEKESEIGSDRPSSNDEEDYNDGKDPVS